MRSRTDWTDLQPQPLVQPEVQVQAAPTRPPPHTATARPGPHAGIAEPGPAAAAPSGAEAEEAVESHPLAGGSPPQERTAPPVEGRAGREGEGEGEGSGSTLRQRRLHRFQPPTPRPPDGEGAEGA